MPLNLVRPRAEPRSLWDNPMGTDGFEFVEYTAPDPRLLGELFLQLGFKAVARHRSKDVTLYRQGEINFIVNAEKDSFAQSFAREHGPSACAMAFRVRDAKAAYERALALGAEPHAQQYGLMELQIPAIKGIGGCPIYLVDRYGGPSIYDVDFVALDDEVEHQGFGLTYIDHLTHNVQRGRMKVWSSYYEKLFNFREIRYFDIEGKLTGLKSQAMTSPCGQIRIPINESSDDKSQIEEFLHAYNGEGIQHIALGTDDIIATVEGMRAKGIKFLDTPDTYYDMVDTRVKGHAEDVARLRANRILIDGAPSEGQGYLLQIFTETVIGPIFFEIIQRKGNEGFGEGNFKALFDSIELDQIRRGVLLDPAAA
ncbi:4-hydroxyphenylpyruvate dioxygenase [Niveibacterium sp. 24ML]|uniref:4-hydroxyphenylpyruvate dioxygenase n=1 Tax=Niveibacterium sp. 24ML TaxID=2985512 RepID=UPI002270CEB3|nr:4-hydroxyphenylpyruvate dioxygenase [Niveibacterium sp. 24ML]MCX9156446.1 4-hydroxyphenylpyruvate dioxygenase [Niveibacterium sp. 24ML]